LPPALANHELVTAAWDGLDPAKVWDSHAHLVGTGDSGSGIVVNPKMQSLLNPGESFEVTFDAPGVYLYYCQVHPDLQRGLIRVLGPAVGMLGDANCSDETDAIDAMLVLQLNAGLLGSLSCQQNADVNGDSRVDSIDAMLILQYTAGLLDQLAP